MCLGITEKEVSRCLPRPPGGKFVLVEGFWLKCGNEPLQDIGGYILTDSVRKNLKNLARVVSARYSVDTSCYAPVLLTHGKNKVYMFCIDDQLHDQTPVIQHTGHLVAQLDVQLINPSSTVTSYATGYPDA